jgi:hypothetical protein
LGRVRQELDLVQLRVDPAADRSRRGRLDQAAARASYVRVRAQRDRRLKLSRLERRRLLWLVAYEMIELARQRRSPCPQAARS